MQTLDRRELLSGAMAGAVVAGVAGTTVAAEIPPKEVQPRSVIDTNVSLFQWPFRRLPLALEVRTNPPSGMMAEELRCFCRVVRGLEAIPTGATYTDAI